MRTIIAKLLLITFIVCCSTNAECINLNLTKITDLPTKDGALLIRFIDHNVGWFVSYQQELWKSIDGGVTWDKVYTPPELGPTKINDIEDIVFINSQIGWMLNRGKLYKSENGGRVWVLQKILSHHEDNYVFTTIAFDKQGKEGYLFGGGWRKPTNKDPKLVLKDKDLSDSKRVIEPCIIYTNDSGKTWSRVKDLKYGLGSLSAVYVNSDLLGIALGLNTPIYMNKEANNKWLDTQKMKLCQSLIIDSQNEEDNYPVVAFRLNKSISWVGYRNGNLLLIDECKSGSSERFMNVKNNPTYFRNFMFFNEKQGIALAGVNNRLHITNDGGHTWELYENREWDIFTFINENNGFLVNNNGELYKLNVR